MVGTGFYQMLKLVGGGGGDVVLGPLVVGVLTAALFGYLSIAGLLALVRRSSLAPFAIYCAGFGLLVLTGVLG
jgi:undecaprenyl-diphosphatase